MTKPNNLLIFILTIGVFGIINTEMGVIGILPSIADHFHVSISKAGLLVSLFALAVAVSGPTMPLLFSGMNPEEGHATCARCFRFGEHRIHIYN